jgi:hypothetical protein
MTHVGELTSGASSPATPPRDPCPRADQEFAGAVFAGEMPIATTARSFVVGSSDFSTACSWPTDKADRAGTPSPSIRAMPFRVVAVTRAYAHPSADLVHHDDVAPADTCRQTDLKDTPAGRVRAHDGHIPGATWMIRPRFTGSLRIHFRLWRDGAIIPSSAMCGSPTWCSETFARSSQHASSASAS